MKFLLISILIISISYGLSDRNVSPSSNDNHQQNISLQSTNIKHNRNHNYSGSKRIRIKQRKHNLSSLNRKYNNNKLTTTTTINPNIVNNSNILYKLNIDYLPGTIKLPVLSIHNLSNHKPIDYDNDSTHWEIPKGQYFTVLQTLMIQRENIDIQIQHTFGLLNAERKLRDEPLLDYMDYSPCNKKNINKKFNNDDIDKKQQDKKEILIENKKNINTNEKLRINQFKSAQIIFNETVNGRLDCQCLHVDNKNE